MKKFFKRLWYFLTYFSAKNRQRREICREQRELDTLAQNVRDGLKPLIRRCTERNRKDAPANTAVLVADGPPATSVDAKAVLSESKINFTMPTPLQASRALTAHNDKFQKRRIDRPDWKQE